MAKRKAPTQLKVPGTLKSIRAARADWRAALATLEESEADAEAKAELAHDAREAVGEAMERFRIATLVLREVEDATDGGQEKLDGIATTPGKAPRGV